MTIRRPFKTFFFFAGFLLIPLHSVLAQNTLVVFVSEAESGNPLAGASVALKSTAIGSITDEAGFAVLKTDRAGSVLVVVSFVGFESVQQNVVLPYPDTLRIALEPAEEELETITVSSTRSTRTIEDEPTRVEVIAGEELDEKSTMKPGELRMLLTESTGIQTQTTSASSGNASIRIQGLDGRFTQLLKDGFPVYSGAASGLGLLQIAPLDLRQVEVIKGSSSTLYGGGAIAGLVNLISKTPGDEPETSILVNGTSAKGLDASVFQSRRINRFGYTFFGSTNRSAAYDPAGIGLSAIPKFFRYTAAPRVFFYPSENVTLNAGLHYSREIRQGGTMGGLNDSFFPAKESILRDFFEQNRTTRMIATTEADWRASVHHQFRAKGSFSTFYRNLNANFTNFRGTQEAGFLELTHRFSRNGNELISGINLNTDQFTETFQYAPGTPRSYSNKTAGLFTQYSRDVNETVTMEGGMRVDQVENYGTVFLPRFAVLLHFSPEFSSRIGGGAGYKTPGFFTEDSERLLYSGVQLPNPDSLSLERSRGLNADVNYKTTFFENQLVVSVNQLFFYTHIRNQAQLELAESSWIWRLRSGNQIAKGAETNLKLEWDDFQAFIGYTFTDVQLDQNGISVQNPLSPSHRVNSFLMYEKEDDFRVGLEAYFTGKQRLSDERNGKSFLILGLMMQKYFRGFSVFLNFENFTDRRQTRFDTIYTGNVRYPVFRDIYAPLDGFLINGGVMIKF